MIIKVKLISSLIGLEDIQVIMLPANEINEYYQNNKRIDISQLSL
ncbi:hypothetical protein [Methanobrevibacter sp.]